VQTIRFLALTSRTALEHPGAGLGLGARRRGAFLCTSGPFPSPVSITRPSTQSTNHPSWMSKPLQAPHHSLGESFPCKPVFDRKWDFFFLTEIFRECMHLLSRPVTLLEEGKSKLQILSPNCDCTIAHRFSAQLFAQSHPSKSKLKPCPSQSVSMGRMHSAGITPRSPQLPVITGEEFLSRNRRVVSPRTTIQPTFLPRHLQHPNRPGIQSTSTAGQSDASHLARTFAKCSVTDSPQDPGEPAGAQLPWPHHGRIVHTVPAWRLEKKEIFRSPASLGTLHLSQPTQSATGQRAGRGTQKLLFFGGDPR